MFPTRFIPSRFFLTFGLLSLVFLLPLLIYYKPLKEHVLATQEKTALVAKSQILGYQIPDFKKFAFNILTNHVFQPAELTTYQGGTHYLSFYQKGSELFPDLFEMHYMEGICYFWLGDLTDAENALRKSLELNPVFFWTNYNLGLLYLKEGKIDGAITFLYRAKKIPPDVTQQLLHDYQDFYSIWQYMPDAQGYINNHLALADREIDYFLLVALAAKNHHASSVAFDPNRWNPVFF